MLFLGFISGKGILFPGKWVKTSKNGPAADELDGSQAQKETESNLNTHPHKSQLTPTAACERTKQCLGDGRLPSGFSEWPELEVQNKRYSQILYLIDYVVPGLHFW